VGQRFVAVETRKPVEQPRVPPAVDRRAEHSAGRKTMISCDGGTRLDAHGDAQTSDAGRGRIDGLALFVSYLA
jgi:hypothetical protein